MKHTVLIVSVVIMCLTPLNARRIEYTDNRNIIHVPAGGDLQQAIDAAQSGDTITLDPGAVYTGNFILKNKICNEFVTITTAGADPLEGTRITPQAASGLAKIVAPNDSPAISTEPGES